MRRWLVLIIICLFIPFAFCAQNSGNPTKYEITVNKVELYNSTTGQWISAKEGDQAFNIASASAANQLVGSFASGAQLTPGTYTQIRVRVKRSMTLRGNVDVGGAAWYTTATQGAIGGTDGFGIVPTNTAANLADGVVVAPSGGNPPNPPAYFISHTDDGDYFIERMNLPASFTINPGQSQRIIVKFDLSNTLTCDNTIPLCWCNPPNVTLDVQ